MTEVIDFLSRGPSCEEIARFHLSEDAYERLRILKDHDAAGELTAEEKAEIDRMVLLDDIFSLIQAYAQGGTARNRSLAKASMSSTHIPAALQ